MIKTLKLAKREYKAYVKSKGFIIGLIIAPLFMSGSLIALWVFKDRVDITDKKVAIIDRSGLIAESLVKASENRNNKEIYDPKTGKKNKPAYLMEVVTPNEKDIQAQRLELSNRVRNGEIHAFLEIGPGVVHPSKDPNAANISYYAKNAAIDDIRGWLIWPINNQLRQLRLADAGIDEALVKDLFQWATVEGLGLVSVDSETGAVKSASRADEGRALGVPIAMLMLIFLMVIMSVSPMISSVMEEKNQRIAEVLLGSVKPFEFMMGKVLGSLGVALTSSSVYIIGGILFLKRMELTSYIPYHILPWFFTYMILAVVMMGAMSAAMGSACSEPKDMQSLSFPSILPAMIPMFIMMPVLREPQGPLATWLSLFPPFTPFLMILRQSTPGGVPVWQPWVGLLGVIIFAIFYVWVGGRIFRVAILMQGTPPKLRNLVRWAIRG